MMNCQKVAGAKQFFWTFLEESHAEYKLALLRSAQLLALTSLTSLASPVWIYSNEYEVWINTNALRNFVSPDNLDVFLKTDDNDC